MSRSRDVGEETLARRALHGALPPARAGRLAAGARHRTGRGGGPGRVRRSAPPLGTAAGPAGRGGLSPRLGGEPFPLDVAAPEESCARLLSTGSTSRRARRREPCGASNASGCSTGWPGCRRRQREVLVLRYYAGLSEAEAASALGISRGAVKSHGSRGMRAMRTVLGGPDERMNRTASSSPL